MFEFLEIIMSFFSSMSNTFDTKTRTGKIIFVCAILSMIALFGYIIYWFIRY